MKIGLTYIAFNHLNGQYVKFLEQAKAHCDYLIVAFDTKNSISTPSSNQAPFALIDRFVQLKACKYVDEIVPYLNEIDMEDICKSFNHDIRFVNNDFKGTEYLDLTYYQARGISVHYYEKFEESVKRRIKIMKN